jgi:hypothetical protein
MGERILRELALVPVKDLGVCTVCNTKETLMQCASCTPHHYICRPCCDTHKVLEKPQD